MQPLSFAQSAILGILSVRNLRILSRIALFPSFVSLKYDHVYNHLHMFADTILY